MDDEEMPAKYVLTTNIYSILCRNKKYCRPNSSGPIKCGRTAPKKKKWLQHILKINYHFSIETRFSFHKQGIIHAFIFYGGIGYVIIYRYFNTDARTSAFFPHLFVQLGWKCDRNVKKKRRRCKTNTLAWFTMHFDAPNRVINHFCFFAFALNRNFQRYVHIWFSSKNQR